MRQEARRGVDVAAEESEADGEHEDVTEQQRWTVLHVHRGEEDGGYCYPQHRLHGAAKECLLSESCPHPDQQGEEHRRDHTQTFRVRSEAKRTEVTAIPNTGCTAPRKSVSSPSPAPTPISKAKSTAATTLKPSGSDRRRRGRRLLLSPTPAARRRERVSPLRVLPPPRSARRRAPPRPHSNLQGRRAPLRSHQPCDKGQAATARIGCRWLPH